MEKNKNIEKLDDKWLRIIGIPAIAIISSTAFYKEERIMYDIPLIKVMLTSLAISVVGWEVNRRILLYYRRKYCDVSDTLKRNLFSFGGYFVFDLIFFAILHVFYNYSFYWNHHLTGKEFIINTSISFFFTSAFGTIYEMIYFFRKWKQTFTEREKLKEENLQNQLDSLRNQINPHFLFNSLNTLEALTEEKSENSSQFVRELANVYRFILQSQDKKLNTLQEELNFINAYYFLLQTRFGNNLQMKIEVNEKYFNHQLPPLTIQLLVENAMKHNVVSTLKPLTIRIYNESNGLLVIENNLQKKNMMAPSNKVGLSNIKKRYEILGANGMRVEHVNNKFAVTVPLIEVNA